jgi:hypothetical protein
MRCRAALLLFSLALISASDAETLTYGIDSGVAETDNVTLVHSDKVSQTMAVLDADFDVKHLSSLLTVDAKGNFTELDYLQHAYGNQLVGRFDGSAILALIPQRLTWTLQEHFGQMALDPFTPMTPVNQENVNFLSTGPDLTLRFSGTEFLKMSARVSRVTFSDSPYSSDRGSGTLAWGVDLSARSSISVNLDSERVLFDNTALNSDFNRSNAFLRYELDGARTELTADLGATRITQSGSAIIPGGTAFNTGGTVTNPGSTASSGGLAKLTLSRRLSAAAMLTLTAGHDLSDSSGSFSQPQGGASGVIAAAPAAATSANYLSNYGSVGWQYQRNRTTFAVSGRYERDTYPGQSQLDTTHKTEEFRVERQMTRAFGAQLIGRINQTEYPHAMVAVVNGNPKQATDLVAAVLTWRHGHGLEVKLMVEHTDYVVTPSSNGYQENRVYLTVGYRPSTSTPVTEALSGS